MKTQSTNISQKFYKNNLILSISAIFIVTAFLMLNTSISLQMQESAMTIVQSSSNSASLSSSSNSTLSSQSLPTLITSQFKSSQNNQVIEIATTTFVGDLDRKENDTIFLSKDNQIRQYIITDNIKIKRDSTESDFGALKIGDSLTVKQSQDGQKVFSIEAVSKQVSDLVKLRIVIAIGALLSILFIIYLVTRPKSGYIKSNISTKN
ncbi:MAG: hypothetical protein H7230_02515 [Candidatus Parcubacteria bacterium]|nr:hypothetical protein [Candidatus Paceibacterota bacterium]